MKKFGFTLAEVLITLGIIGVVAALTIPTLMTNYKAHRNRVAFKKAISTLSQAGRMNAAQHDWDYSNIDVSTDCNAEEKSFCTLFMNTLSGVTVIDGNKLKIKDSHPNCDGTETYCITDEVSFDLNYSKLFILSDGTYIISPEGAEMCTAENQKTEAGTLDWDLSCVGLVDVNGPAGPNKRVQCDEGTSGENCIVSNKNLNDIFLIDFYDTSAGPSVTTDGAERYILNTTK